MPTTQVKRLDTLRAEIDDLRVCCEEWRNQAEEAGQMVDTLTSFLVQVGALLGTLLEREGILPSRTGLIEAVDAIENLPESSGPVYKTVHARAIADATASAMRLFFAEMRGIRSFLDDRSERTRISRPAIPAGLSDDMLVLLNKPIIAISDANTEANSDDEGSTSSDPAEEEDDSDTEMETVQETALVLAKNTEAKSVAAF